MLLQSSEAGDGKIVTLRIVRIFQFFLPSWRNRFLRQTMSMLSPSTKTGSVIAMVLLVLKSGRHILASAGAITSFVGLEVWFLDRHNPAEGILP